MPLKPEPIADVIGPTFIPRIVVGRPSPTSEPEVIGNDYLSVPFCADTVVDGWSTWAMTIRGTSQRGHLHRLNGAPRQDDFVVDRLPDGRVIIAAADGVSQARQSHIGASTAVRQAASWLRQNIAADVSETDWLNLFQSTAYALNKRAESIFELPQPDPARTEAELATTLITAVIEPTDSDSLRAYVAGCGDSSVWLLSRGAFIPVLGGKSLSDSGVASSEVVGLPRVPRLIAPQLVEIAVGEVLLIGSDGIGDPLGHGEGGVGNLLRDLLSRRIPPSLVEFAHAVDFSRESYDDDRTLVAVWPTGSFDNSAPG
jgi:hypothetical protein